MTTNPRRSSMIISIAMAVVNGYIVHRYSGILLMGVYIVAMGIAYGWIQTVTHSPQTIRRLQWGIVIVTFAGGIAALFMFAPSVDAWVDRDSAITTWLSQLAHGRYPYQQPTNLGNPISVFPIIPLIAAPFVLLGNVGYLEITAYLFLIALLHSMYAYAPHTRLYAIFMLSSAPLLFMEIIYRSELIVNITLILAFIGWLVKYEHDLHSKHIIIISVALGLLAATRLALWPVLVLISLYLAKSQPLKTTAWIIGIASITAGLFIAPFILWDSTTFIEYAPIGVNADKLGDNPGIQVFWLLLTAAAVIISGWKVRHAQQLYVYIIPVLLVIVAGTWFIQFVDVSLLQFIFIPLLFILPVESYKGKINERRL